MPTMPLHSTTRLSPLIASYCSTLKPVKRWSTAKDYALTQLDAALGARPLASITTASLQDWAISDPRASTTKTVMLSFLCDVFRFGRLRWQLPIHEETPRDTLRILIGFGLLKPAAQRDRRVSDRELDQIASVWSARTPPAALYILRDTAMRVSEFCALTWSDIDLDARIAHLRHRKARGAMRIPIFGQLRHWWRLKNIGHPRVCPQPAQTISRAFQRAARSVQINDIRLHDLRHEGTSRLAEAGLSPAQMQAVTGHKSIRSLERYTHVTAESVAAIAHDLAHRATHSHIIPVTERIAT